MHVLQIGYVRTVIFIAVLLAFEGGYSFVFCAQKVDVFVAIPLSSPQLKTFRNSIVRIQKKIKKAALEQKYEFDIVAPEKLHITLESVPNAERNNLKLYEQCVQSAADSTEYLDLTNQLRQAKLELMGKENNWAALQLAVQKDDPLSILAQRLRTCFKKSGLKHGPYVEFKSHISLGIFHKNKHASLPADLSWVPAVNIVLPDASLLVKHIILSTREKIENEGTLQRVVGPEQLFALQGRPVRNPSTIATAVA